WSVSQSAARAGDGESNAAAAIAAVAATLLCPRTDRVIFAPVSSKGREPPVRLEVVTAGDVVARLARGIRASGPEVFARVGRTSKPSVPAFAGPARPPCAAAIAAARAVRRVRGAACPARPVGSHANVIVLVTHRVKSSAVGIDLALLHAVLDDDRAGGGER